MDIDICICTYQRAHVAETLRSIARLEKEPDWKIRVIVADNDETPSARMVVETTAREQSLNLVYIHAPARNISIARNACLNAATAPLLAFIDDDEIADPAWLKELVTTFEKTKADVVLGPVRAVYNANCPRWMVLGDFHSTMPVWVGDEIITGYTCNCLLRRTAPSLQGLQFRPELGRSGGEDTAFFAAVHDKGGKIAFAPNAIVTEPIPADRARMAWLLKRRFRFGEAHGWLLLESAGKNLSARVKNIALATGKASFCLGMSLLSIIRPVRMRFWLLRGTMHAGVVARLLGKRELEMYG